MAVSFVLVPTPVGAAVTATSTTLPGTFGAMVIDATTGHVFVSLPDTSKVVVLDFSGNILATISGQSGAEGMALSGGFLYVVDATARRQSARSIPARWPLLRSRAVSPE